MLATWRSSGLAVWSTSTNPWNIHNFFLQCNLAILVYLQLFWSIELSQGYFGQSESILVVSYSFWLFLPIMAYICLSLLLSVSLRLSPAISGYIGLSQAVTGSLDCPRLSWAILRYLELSTAISFYSGLSLTISGYLGHFTDISIKYHVSGYK